MPKIESQLNSLPQIESQLSNIQQGVNANTKMLDKLKPLINTVSSIESFVQETDSKISSIESYITGIPSDFKNMITGLEATIPKDLATFGSNLSKLPEFSSLLKAENDITKYLPFLYLNVKSSIASIESDLNGLPLDIQNLGSNELSYLKSLKSDFSRFESSLNAFTAMVNALPSNLKGSVVSALTPELNNIEGNISPIVSDIENYISPMESTISDIKSTVNGIPSSVSSLGSRLSSLGSYFGF